MAASFANKDLAHELTMEHLTEALHCAASLKAGITMAHGLVTQNIVHKKSL
jgi:hypothetical protein